LEDKIIDFTDGVADLNKKHLRILGSPGNRFREDPVRILRVIRVSAKLGFTIPPKIEKQIKKKLNLLKDVSSKAI
jgi:poly(A) polymerase